MVRKLTALVITFWVGGLWVTGISASILFDAIDNRSLAGNVAGQLFQTMSYIGLASGLFLLVQRFIECGMQGVKQHYVWIVSSMLLLIIIGFFGVQSHLAQLKAAAYPVAVMQSAYAKQFAVWHGISGVIYLIQCLLGVMLVMVAWRD